MMGADWRTLCSVAMISTEIALDLEVVEVDGWRRLRQFIELPERIYLPQSPWVAPMRMHVRHMMGRLRGADRRYVLALHRGQPVARLGGRIHRYGDEAALHFGFFECQEGFAKAARLLVESVHAVAPQLPMRGPYHHRQEDPYTGLLVEGFEHAPSLMMPYNPPYYAEYLQAAGLRPLADLYSYTFARGTVRLDVMQGRAQRARQHGITVRDMDPRQRLRDTRYILDMVNRTHRDLWGFEEFVGDLAEELLLLGRFVLDPRGVFLAFHDGRPVGFVIIVPDVNRLLKPSRGRVTPALIWRLLFGRKTIDEYRAYGMGVVPESRSLGVSAALVQAVMDVSHVHPWRSLEIAWTLASNHRMNAMALALGGTRNKVHRVYERPALT